MKAFTDILQSKKLAEMLPSESADMCWTPFDEKWDAYLGSPNPDAIKKEIPCWSLAALLSLLPNNEHIETTISRGGWEIDPIEYLPNTWWCEYEDNESLTEFNTSADNPVDACYEMILKLHELKML